MIKYSVVITYCCNRKKELETLLKSIYSQTIPPDEVIIVSDGIAKELYDLKFKTCLVEANKVGRPGPLRNQGIKKSRNQFIFISDDDDIWHPQKAEIQLSTMDGNNIGFCFTEKLSFKTESELTKTKHYKHFKIKTLNLVSLLIRNNLPLSSCLFNRAIVNPVFNTSEDVRGWADYDLWLREVRSTKIVKIRAELLFYRSHQGSMRNGQILKMIETQKQKLLKEYNLGLASKLFITIVYSLRWIKWKYSNNEF